MSESRPGLAEASVDEPVAIIGIGCRFPGGASSPDRFWQLLLDGADTVGDVPADRWNVDDYYHPDPGRPGRTYTRQGSFLDDVYMFDADFFKISPREAAWIDPQQRLLLELAWEALEDGWQVPRQLAGSDTGVFVGICSTEYRMVRRQDFAAIDAYTNTGTAMSVAANRISYALDLRGPSVAVDTACSSSLVAVHLAGQSLRQRECRTALAGGINLMFDPATTVGFARASMLSPTGRCHSFDESADGFVRAEGAGLVVMKLLADALADEDPIYAVIRGSGVNQDGRTNGIALPNGESQIALLRQVYANAGIAPTAVRYVEAHGTGTPAGDPIECDAIGTVLGVGRDPGDPLRIGSVKTNIGHTEGASGIAGLIKAALALKHRYIPANLHFTTPNPRIPFADLGCGSRPRARTGPPATVLAWRGSTRSGSAVRAPTWCSKSRQRGRCAVRRRQRQPRDRSPGCCRSPVEPPTPSGPPPRRTSRSSTRCRRPTSATPRPGASLGSPALHRRADRRPDRRGWECGRGH